MTIYRPGHHLIIPGARVLQPGGGGASTLLTGIRAYWKLDEASGTRLDSTTNALHLSIISVPIGSVAGKVGSASDHTPYTAGKGFRRSFIPFGDADFTFAGWFYAAAVTDAYSQVIVASGNPHWSSSMTAYYLSSWNGTKIRWSLGNGASSAGIMSAAFSLAAWHFFEAWYDSVSDQLGLSVDGSVPVVASLSGGVTSNPFTYVGTQDNPVYTWNGYLDEIGMWDRLLTPTERLTLQAGVTYPFL